MSRLAPDLFGELLRQTPSVWCEEVRFLRDQATEELSGYHFVGRPYLRDILDCDARRVVIMKSAQCGATELAINWGLHDTLCQKRDVLTVLPKDDTLKTFVQGRVDRAFRDSPVLKTVKPGTSNPKHKSVGGQNWYFRASNSPSELVEIPVQTLLLDEVDRLNPKAIPMARKRMQGCPEHRRREKAMSTPTRAGLGIHMMWRDSSQAHWLVPCPHCGAEQELRWGANRDFPRPEVGDDWDEWEWTWRCSSCEAPWTEAERMEAIEAGHWEHEYPNRSTKGFHISALYSPTETAASVGQAYQDAVKNDDPNAMIEFWNQVLGLPFSDGTDRLTDDDINRVRLLEPFNMPTNSPDDRLVSMGVDQSPKHIHVEIREWREKGDVAGRQCRAIAYFKVTEWEDLDDLIERYAVSCCVVDCLPEQRPARDLQSRFPGIVWLATYQDTLKSLCEWKGWGEEKDGATGPLGMSGGYVRINRTEAIDRVFARFRGKCSIALPQDLPDEARRHLKALYAVEGQDRWGNPVKRYENGSKADHYAHAMVYAEIAGLQVRSVELAELPDNSQDWDLERNGAGIPGVDDPNGMDALGFDITGI